jgi:hypothetical protein
MKTLISAFLLACLAVPTAGAAVEDAPETPVLRTGQRVTELRSWAARLATSSGNTDTLWVGYTPSAVSSTNWWGVYAGFGKDGFYRPTNGVPHQGVWDWEAPVHGDSLQGWWPILNLYASTGSQTRTDRNRPWWAIDIGNMANYVINQANGRTFGVTGVWHRDGGALAAAPPGLPAPDWSPAQGSYAAWMGLRAHGDATYSDPETGNPFNEDVLMFTGFGAVSSGGNDQGFPGYGSQMDQMLYRDVDLTGNTDQSLAIRFKFRTVMSNSIGTSAATRVGWFDSDPLGTTGGPVNPQRNNFISSSEAGDALAPRDSFMVYVGQPVDEAAWSPAAANFGQSFAAQPVYDPRRRWFGEVLRWDRDPGSPPTNPQPLYYRELLSVTGNRPFGAEASNSGYVDTTFTISSAALQPLIRDNRVRVVFRVKTNRGFDDQGTSYSSNKRGAAVVDRVSYQIGGGADVVFGDFENVGDIDNAPATSAVAAWKSTGKPPGIFHHTHLFSDLLYEDLCGRKGDVSRICNMSGVVISMGDHDHGEAAGGLLDGSAQRELNDGIMSPTIQLCGPYDQPGGKNRHGFRPLGSGPGDIDASEDFYLLFDIYTGIFDTYYHAGNLWRFAVMSYPGNAKSSHGSYPAWGQMRIPGTGPFISGAKECLTDLWPLYQFALVKTSNANGIPDSIKVFVGKTQQCFRFGVTTGCSSTDGGYLDNVTFAVVDGEPDPLSVDSWHWINDAFPASEVPSLPGTASFDTAAAHAKTAWNTAQSFGYDPNGIRYDVPGDSTIVSSAGGTARVDLVFRILPGPGDYEPVGRPDIGTIVKRPDSRAVVTKGDGSFWDQYRQTPGDFASPNAVALHHSGLGGWDPNVWNSARCDTAEQNLFARQNPAFGYVLGGPADPSVWMTTYHESDPHFNTLGIVHNRCFLRTASSLMTDIVCDGTVPSYISSRPEHADVTGTTREGTKILPDGLLTPGAHVEYFFRRQTGVAPGAAAGLFPDTSIVIDGKAWWDRDAHRWQEFSVLPNAWKKPAYFHPVARSFGTGPACLLVIDQADLGGNETAWVGVADTIGATPQRWWGAHNGWHAIGGGNLNDPAANRRGADGQPGFISEHLGQGGSGGSWDFYQVKGNTYPGAAAGSIGSRYANKVGGSGQQIVIAKSSHQGPSLEMLNSYYTMILMLTGDLTYGILGPRSDHSQNDTGLLMQWMDAADTTIQNRAFWAIGDGFAESIIEDYWPLQIQWLYDYLGTGLVNPWYSSYTGNTEELVTLRVHPEWRNQAAGQTLLYGVRNRCTWTNDVLYVWPGTPAVVASHYESRRNPGTAIAAASIFKDWTPSSPYKTLVDGWNLEHLTHPADVRTLDRSGYFHRIFTEVWSKLCVVQGTPLVPLDVPQLGDESGAFVALRNNPTTSGRATIRFGLPKADRVEIAVFDVSGRLVRTLADRRFAAGEHEIVWDGLDDRGHAAARGVYFTRVRYRETSFDVSRKLTVLR